ncbi:MAG: hypothetical protein HGA65_09325 [Oscillochloris sp.]|nr:hypothetical protein [Oscillochloris sp.]
MTSISTQKHVCVGAKVAGLARPLLMVLLLLATVWLLWFAADRAIQLLGYPYPTDTLEGTLLHEARLMRAGAPLYQPLEHYSFVSAPYPPLHPLLLALVDLLVGPHLFWSGRLVSLVAALMVGLMVCLTIRFVTGCWSAGLFATAMLLSAPPVFIWATRIKPDLFALMWTTGGLAVATWAASSRGRVANLRLVAAATCFALAFLTKQTAVAAPLATGVALLIGDLLVWRRRRSAAQGSSQSLPSPQTLLSPQTLIFGFSYLILTLGMWFVLDQIYAGQYTVHVWWSGDRVRWWSLGLFLKLVGLILPYWPLLLLGALGAIVGLYRQRDRILACYTLIAPLTLSAAGETGANHNHLLETLLAFNLSAGVLIGRHLMLQVAHGIETGWPRLIAGYSLIIALLLIQGGLLLKPHPWYGSELDPTMRSTPERFVAFMRGTPGEILADDPGLLMLAGKPIRYDDASTMGPAAAIGKWDQRGLIEDITHQRFSAIMLPINVNTETSDPAGRWSPEVLAAIRQYYTRLYYDEISTYVPR